jgi:hypothetical protein
MRRIRLLPIVLMALAGTMLLQPLHAQDEEYGEDSRLNTNLAIPFSIPLNPTARFVNFGVGLVVGAGYNITSRHAIVGEFMWNRLHVNDAALLPIRVAAQNFSINGHGDLFALTANYRYELRGRTFGTYFIGGGGLYYRSASITKPVISANTISCTPEWQWWGFTCQSGSVSSDQTLAKSSSGVAGVNGGIGITIKVAEPRYRFYVESRYHYAPNNRINTQLIPITIGIRF